MNSKEAQTILEKYGYKCTITKAIEEGSNHHVFDSILEDGKSAIIKFAKTRKTESGLVEPMTDTLSGSRLSVERESYLFKMIREQCSVPSPQVYGTGKYKDQSFIIVEKMPGESFTQMLRLEGHREEYFLTVIRSLATDFARIQNVTWPSFGSIMDGGVIDPANVTNFADRFEPILKRRLLHAYTKKAFDQSEYKKISQFFLNELSGYRDNLDINNISSCLVFTDMHGENFFTLKDGSISAYFDLESAQAAPAILEFYGFRFFLFNFYDQESFDKAEKEFWNTYLQSGGKYMPNHMWEWEFIDFLSACRLLELTDSYWGIADGIRDSWGKAMKELLYEYIDQKTINYIKLGEIWRQRDGGPSVALK